MSSPRTLEARNAAAIPVGSAIRQVKNSINVSLVQIGEVLTNIGKARLDEKAHMPMTIGMLAAEQAAKAASALTEAYRYSVEAHRQLSIDKDVLGLKTLGWGANDTFKGVDHLRIAAESEGQQPDQDRGELRVVA